MLGPGDIAGRIGGEEFSIYLNGIQDEAQLQHVIDTLLGVFAPSACHRCRKR
ncbi:hypothetical protein MKC71_20965 [[Clostridium] innocuum]|nr:hypothetical protein [[Clostridium] innocuum]MCR0562286.1 hypothetical protein [[Clostridium] innocuum]